jgi:RNA polymerase sigma-70 factor (ECF subfamily)
VNIEAVVAPDARHAPAREATAFDRLFLAEYPAVMRIAHRVLADAAEAEDVAQEVFLSFHRRHRADAPFAVAWLRAAAAHTALNAVRSRGRRSRREAANAQPDGAIDPHEAAEANEARREVREALARLPEKAGVDIGQVGTMLRRAEVRLRKELRT